ncbi:MAG: AAA family ATPase [Pseudomonadota bacterium]
MSESAIIRYLQIERFRGLQMLNWTPAETVNIILGGGDVGKSTVLDAIALLLSPNNSVILSEADYWHKNTEDGFLIRAFFTLPASTDINHQRALSWPWEWNGKEAVPPVLADEGDDIADPAQPVYCLQARGTPELEVVWEIVQPNDETTPLSTALRRLIGVIRLSGEERNDRDLRLVYGSALDRLLADPGLRARIGQEVSNIDLQAKLSEDAKKSLGALDVALKDESLPHSLDVGLTSAQGLSIGALVGLLAQKTEEVTLPISSWGAGTRRMVTLQIAASTQASTRITVIDELERGLEPYRARKLVGALEKDKAQSFVTTHSPVVVSAAKGSQLWYMDAQGGVGELTHHKIKVHQARSPLTFLSKFAIVCEGITEVGVLSVLLEKSIEGQYRDHGVFLADGEGNSTTLDLLEVLSKTGLRFAGFADDEGDRDGKWTALKASMGDALLKWQAGNTEANILAAIPDEHLEAVIEDDVAEKFGVRRRHLADRLGISDKSMPSIHEALAQQDVDLRTLMIAAASGNSDGAPDDQTRKEWKKHGQQWFKSEAGGRELAGKMIMFGAWPELSAQFMPLLNAVRLALGQEPVEGLKDERR